MCEWIRTEFDPATSEKACGRKRVLLMDGHSSHFTPEVIEFALERNIAILGYPPHCTHALQGLDVVCFAKMKFEMKKSVADFEDKNQRVVDKPDFLLVFGRAFNRAFTVEAVKAAFSATGVYPFNPGIIRPEQMKPAEATSVTGSFALTQTSPVQAIIQSFRAYHPTAFDLSPSNAIPLQPIASSSHIPTAPSTPVASGFHLMPTS